MATYFELLTASENSDLRNRIRVAVVVAAETIRTENPATANHTERLAWAKGAFASPDAAAETMMWPVLAQNKAAAYAAIVGASDASVQSAVDAAVNVFAI